VFNLRKLNQYVAYEHFKMESMTMLPALIQPKDWVVKMDLKDAYFCVPIAPEHQPLLGFWWENQAYMFQVCPFGLGSAPRLFTKILKPVVSFLRRIGIRLIMYLDDCLILNQDQDRLIRDRDTALWVLQMLGFVINWNKSSLIPTRCLEFLGFQVDSTTMSLLLPMDKIQDIQHRCSEMIKKPSTTVRQLAKLIGKLTATAQAVLPAPLFYRRLQMQKSKALLLNKQSYEAEVHLTAECRQELRWWIEELSNCNGKAIMRTQPDLVITSDASKTGWGGICNGVRAQGQWSKMEAELHINLLEMKAAEFMVKAFTKDQTQIHCHLRLDNSSCAAQINKMGGTRSLTLFQAAKSLWTYCLQRQITLTAEHLPGKQNVVADEQSREFSDASNWKLHTVLFQALHRKWGPWTIDLFADRLNAQLRRYASWKPDPEAVQVDAFLMDWKSETPYAFPPFCLISRCLGKIRKERATVVMITPVWHAQVWYPQLLEMLVELPLLLPPWPQILTSPRGQDHPMVMAGHLQLAAWKVSGETCKVQEFQSRLQRSCRTPNDPELKRLTAVPGKSGLAGVVQDRWIPFEPLWSL